MYKAFSNLRKCFVESKKFLARISTFGLFKLIFVEIPTVLIYLGVCLRYNIVYFAC